MIRAVSVAAALLVATCAHPQEAAQPGPGDAKTVAESIAREVAEIRGLPFKRPVGVEMQSTASFGEYVSRRIDEVVPETIRRHYGKIVRTLGLYRGPAIDDFTAFMATVMTSQVAAYYDPDQQRFYVLMSGGPEMMQGALYSHELYHALQDQYFALARYLETGSKRGSRSVNTDELLARQAVVEGEATYVMSLWLTKKMTHSVPPREVMARMVAIEANLTMDQIREALKRPGVAQLLGGDLQGALQSAPDIPPFILDSMLGVYLKGLSFVFAVQEQGWSAVEKLYTDYPPQSTEQILHPEKWLAREAPDRFEWPDFNKVAPLKAWELLDNDVLGEFQWRLIFKEHGLASEAESAAGWGGDRYAVFKRKDSDATLLLLRTSWDTETDATEFVDAYRRVLEVKYAGTLTPTRVVREGVDVFVVEGSDEASIDSLLKVVRQAKKHKRSTR